MDKRLKDIVVRLLQTNYGECYDIYVDYCKAKGIKQEVFRCDYDGINALFDDPAQAVYSFANADLKPNDCGGNWAHIYLNDSLRLTYCDDITEKVNISPMVDWIFSLEDYDRTEMFMFLDELDVVYDICRSICKDKSTHFTDRFSIWLEDNELYNLESFVEEDWDILLARFEDTIS